MKNYICAALVCLSLSNCLRAEPESSASPDESEKAYIGGYTKAIPFICPKCGKAYSNEIFCVTKPHDSYCYYTKDCRVTLPYSKDGTKRIWCQDCYDSKIAKREDKMRRINENVEEFCDLDGLSLDDAYILTKSTKNLGSSYENFAHQKDPKAWFVFTFGQLFYQPSRLTVEQEKYEGFKRLKVLEAALSISANPEVRREIITKCKRCMGDAFAHLLEQTKNKETSEQKSE
jgi:hypothetical protein